MPGIGPQTSKMCGDMVAEFFECRKVQGISGMATGLCGELLREMNKCLDEESAIRRRENAEASKIRKEKLKQLLAASNDDENNLNKNED